MIVNDVKTITENLDDFIDVPEGIKRLRSEVLSLAVSGKLVPQDPSEGTAEELYEKIKKEKAKAEEGGRKRKKKEFAPVSDEEIPFEVPNTWKWVRMGQVYSSTRGVTFPASAKSKELLDDSVAVLRSGNVQDRLTTNDLLFVSSQYIKSDDQVVREGDVIVSMANSRELVGKSCIATNVDTKYVIGGFLSIFRPFVDAQYFQYYFSSGVARAQMFKDAKQLTNIANLSLKITDAIPFPLPPLAEQKRIVAKIDELMRVIDELEAKKKERDHVRSAVAKSAFHSLGLNDPSVAIEEMNELVRELDDVKELGKGILSLAVSGKLVPQDALEGTAEVLYEKIQEERARGAKESGKRLKAYPPVEPDEITFEIPTSWKWVRLGDLGFVSTGGTPKTSQLEYYGGDVDFIGPGDISEGRIKSSSKKLTALGAKESIVAQNGDILMVCIGGTIGKTALVKKGPITFNQQINKIAPVATNSTYLFLVLSSGYFRDLIVAKASGAATPIVNASKWSECLIPLPPIVEQKRIVEKVDELMEIVNKLRTIIKDD